MPSRSQSRDASMSSGDIWTGLELRRNSRQHSTSKAMKEKALSPRASLRTRDKTKTDIPIRPPHADLPFEFVKSGGSGISMQTKAGGNHHWQQAGKNASKEGELVKHMSSLPSFLQRGEKPQDKILNFGVLDWERLEKWKHTQKPSSGRSRASASCAGSSSSAHTKGSSIASNGVKTEVLPSRQNHASHPEISSSEKVTGFQDFTSAEKYSSVEQWRKSRKDKTCVGATSEKRSHKSSKQKESLEVGMPSSKVRAHSISTSKENISDDMPKQTTEKKKSNGLESDPMFKDHYKKQDSIVLLLPKDFSRSGCLDESPEIFFDGNSAELNWSSFSDVFSIEELHFEESTSDLPHSCPLPTTMADSELDINLDRIIHDQRLQLPSQASLSAHLDHKLFPSHDVNHEENKKKERRRSTTSEASKGLDLKTTDTKPSDTTDPPPTRQFSFGIGRLSRSLSFKEGSTLPQLKHVSIRSGPAQALNFDDSSTDKAGNAIDRGMISPFRRLLNPILKPKASNPINLADSSLKCAENFQNFSMKGISNVQAVTSGKYGSAVKNAVLQLTVKSGLPLFKFLVENNNEILASNVKSLSTFGRDDPSWLYCFYSVQEVKRKSGIWMYQGNKGKTPDFSYNVIGQMKVSKPSPYGEEDKLEEKIMRESVLYGVDLSKVDEAASESAVSRELGAIVMKMPKEVSGDDLKKYDVNNSAEIIIPGSIVVILPGAVHSLPSKGEPASLIDRWRTGGLCDCGGWDVGCKLQILANQDQDGKLLRSFSAYPLQQHCNLFLQGTGYQNKPVFRLLACGEGLYSVEYDSAISSLQAFAISVAVLSDQKQPNLAEANSYTEEIRGHYRSKSSIVQGEGTRYATYPPHSPVARA